MKGFKYIFIFLIVSGLFSCVENEPTIENFPNERISFLYEVVGDYELDFLIGSEIKFINTSEATGSVTWDFGDGSATSQAAEPTHQYELPGIYDVSLKIEGEGVRTNKIYISDIIPDVFLQPIEGGICIVGETYIQLGLELPNPDNKTVKYEWSFPEGTVDEKGDAITSFAGELPGKLKFSNIGSQEIKLKVTMGDRELQEGVMKIPVGYTQDVKTIYYAVKKGNIMAYKLITDLPEGIKNSPFDLGVKSGQHPMNILYADTLLYVIDAGKQIGYVNDLDENLGDGKISVIAKDGSRVETLLTNNQGTAFNDPHFGYIDETAQMLYYTDRNTGIRRIGLAERNLQLSKEDSKYNYYVQNSDLGYYNRGFGYGAIHSCFTKVNGVWWWGKTYNEIGIFRFTDADINSGAVPAAGKTAGSLFTKSFVVDEARNMLIMAIRDGATAGIYAVPLDEVPNETAGGGTLQSKIANYLVQAMTSDDEGAASEYIDICQMALDPEDGSVYFGYRGESGSPVVTGLKRCYPDGGIYKVETLVEGVEIYGVAINHNKAKVF